MEEPKTIPEGKKYNRAVRKVTGLLLLVIAVLCMGLFVALPPISEAQFPVFVEIEDGMSLKQVAQELKQHNLIRSRTAVTILVSLSKGDGGVVSGMYEFKRPASVFTVVNRITTGDYGIPLVTVRVPEGATHADIAEIFDKRLPRFNKENFFVLLQERGIDEGFLFPDTYQFLETTQEGEVIELLNETFIERVINSEIISTSNINLHDIVIMASIIEKEATKESRQEVGDILWHRIGIDMPLQVDATFVYSIGKGTFDLYKDDLRDDTNPYNTYQFRGLPPTAISNPSLAAMEAAANPRPTDYLFFLTGSDGEMYYAETFEQHKINRNKL